MLIMFNLGLVTPETLAPGIGDDISDQSRHFPTDREVAPGRRSTRPSRKLSPQHLETDHRAGRSDIQRFNST
jgi:hypothetical protein